MKTLLVGCALGLALAGGGCGEDKNYGAPLDDPAAAAQASAAITNASALSVDTTNDSSLAVLNGLSANMNLLAGIKLQREQATARVATELRAVDEACVVVSESGIVYESCDWNGVTVDGSVMRSGDHVSIDLQFVSDGGTGTVQTTTVDGEIDISPAAIDGFIDYDVEVVSQGYTSTVRFDGDFDVDLQDGCPVGGQLEIHAVASAAGRSESVWVKAEYGPSCGDVAVY